VAVHSEPQRETATAKGQSSPPYKRSKCRQKLQCDAPGSL